MKVVLQQFVFNFLDGGLKNLVLMMAVIIVAVAIFSAVYYLYRKRVFKHGDEKLQPLVWQIQEGASAKMFKVAQVYKISQKYLGIPPRLINTSLRIKGFTYNELANLFYLALNLGPTASLQYGWRAQKESGMLSQNGSPLIWVTFQDERKHSFVVTVKGSEAELEFLEAFVSPDRGALVVSSRMDQSKMDEVRKELSFIGPVQQTESSESKT